MGYISISCHGFISITIENVYLSHSIELTWTIREGFSNKIIARYIMAEMREHSKSR